MNRFTFSFFSFTVCFCLASSAMAWPDTIDADRRHSGTITAMTPDSITINTSSGERIIPSEEVKRVTFENEPVGLKNAKLNTLQGRLNAVGEELDKIGDLPSDQNLRLEILFYRANAAAKLALIGEEGTLSEAVKAVGAFVNDPAATESYHYYEGVDLFGDLAIAMGRPDAAEKYYAKILTSKSDTYRLNGLTKVADAQMAQGKFAEARASYEEATKIQTDTPEARDAKLLAGVGRASCLVEEGKADEAIKYLNDLIRTEDSQKSELFGRAYNALGKAYLKQDKKKESLHAYLFTDVIFFSNPANHSEALYYLQQLWTDLGREDRAREAKQTLNDRYQNTLWAQKLKGG